MFVLCVPWILIILLLISLFLLFVKKRKYAVAVFSIFIILNCLFECIPLRLFTINKSLKKNKLSVMCFNIDGNKDDARIRIPQIAKLILDTDVDIVFLAEFSETDRGILGEYLADSYPFSTYIWNLGHCFYSKYPLTPQRVLKNKDKKVGVYRTSLLYKNDTIYLYGCHLASNNFTENDDYLLPENIADHHTFITYLKDIKIASEKRKNEVNVLKGDLKSEKKIIVMGDFNDIGGSRPIRSLEAIGLKDAWWEGGVGYGATIKEPLPYRIDHVMYSGKFDLEKIKVVSSADLSDHDALYAVVGFN